MAMIMLCWNAFCIWVSVMVSLKIYEETGAHENVFSDRLNIAIAAAFVFAPLILFGYILGGYDFGSGEYDFGDQW